MKTEEKEKCIEAMDFMKDWGQWRSTLKDAIQEGRKMGLSDEAIQSISANVGDFLATKVCPATKEEELLKEMWAVATPAERKMLASLIFRMVD
jgi:sulfur relay (sulfurtransferase) DsrC/TusE family protein